MGNECGACVLSTDADFENYGRDCAGKCGQIYSIDECGQCLLPSDEAWNECNEQDTKVDGDSGGGMDTTLIALIGSGAFVLICCAFVVIVFLYQKHKEMKRQFDEIKKNYHPMDDLPASKKKKQKKMKQSTKEIVPDQEADDDVNIAL